jgi:hypothetical protein
LSTLFAAVRTVLIAKECDLGNDIVPELEDDVVYFNSVVADLLTPLKLLEAYGSH